MERAATRPDKILFHVIFMAVIVAAFAAATPKQ